MGDDQPNAAVADRVRITDEQDETGKTTYSVVIDHMDHGVVIEAGDHTRASEIESVLLHELSRAYEDGVDGGWISVEERLPGADENMPVEVRGWASYRAGQWMAPGPMLSPNEAISHWRPIQKPPEEQP